MGTTLTGTTPQDTYDSLIKVTDNGPLSGTLKKLTDGLGNDSALSLSTGAAQVTGTTTFLGGDGLYINSTAGDISNIFTSPSTHGLLIDFPSSYFLAIRGTAEYMRITSAGNVGIGTSSPASLLHISQAAADTTLRIGNNSSYDQFIYFNGNNDWSLGMDYSNSNAFVLCNASTVGTNNRLVVTTAGVLQIPQGQIQFPSTQVASADPNTLDDYEEGTWTPSASALTLNFTVTSSNGHYTKIGNVVTVSFDISWTSVNVGGAAQTYISNLPFTVKGATGSYYGGSVGFITSTAAVDQFTVRADAYGTSLYVIQRINGSASSDAPASIWGATNRLIASVTYLV